MFKGLTVLKFVIWGRQILGFTVVISFYDFTSPGEIFNTVIPNLLWCTFFSFFLCNCPGFAQNASSVRSVTPDVSQWKAKLREPRHGKTNKLSVPPAKTQISLGIRPAWSESSLYVQWTAKDPRFLHADSEDSGQTGHSPRLVWVFAGLSLSLLVLSCRGSRDFVGSKSWIIRVW